MKTKILTLIAIGFISFTSCKKEDPEFNQISTLEITDDLQIGRVLFYDKHLSINNTTACASCHKQQFAFADNVSFSTGFNNQKTLRNSPPIQNLGIENEFGFPGFALNTLLFWDGRESNLTEMMLQPMVNHREMGITDLDQLCEKLESIDYYQELFLREYGDTAAKLITAERIAVELERFVSSITSVSRLDNNFFGMGLNLTPQENLGMNLFINKYDCGSCHNVLQTTGYQVQDPNAFANIGLDGVYADKGLGAITGKSSDNGKFKIPSLRNVAITAPYMHDGRFSSLSEVIDHYSHGISNNKNLDTKLQSQSGSPAIFRITDHEKTALIAFLNALTDYNMISDPNLADPFVTKYK